MKTFKELSEKLIHNKNLRMKGKGKLTPISDTLEKNKQRTIKKAQARDIKNMSDEELATKGPPDKLKYDSLMKRDS